MKIYLAGPDIFRPDIHGCIAKSYSYIEYSLFWHTFWPTSSNIGKTSR